MRSGFSDPINIRNQKPVDKPVDGKKSPWDFRCPQYDERSSCYVNAGTHYGVGRNQPVGHKNNPTTTAPTLPRDRRTVRSMKDDEVG